jgi:hypothetical protein
MHCYCSICRKTAGGGGYAINLGADFSTLVVTGKRYLRKYQAKIDRGGDADTGHTSTGQRHFCGRCGSALWFLARPAPILREAYPRLITQEKFSPVTIWRVFAVCKLWDAVSPSAGKNIRKIGHKGVP